MSETHYRQTLQQIYEYASERKETSLYMQVVARMANEALHEENRLKVDLRGPTVDALTREDLT